MAERSGFFNSLSTGGGKYDREYQSEDLSSYMYKFISDGVYADTTDALKVVAKSGLTVTVKKGNAFIEGHYYELDEDMDITFKPNSTAYNISDIVACTLFRSDRIIKTIGNNEVSSVMPTNDEIKHELVLASINLAPGVSQITDADITDLRPYEQYCGFVTGFLEQIKTGELFTQFTDMFNTWFENIKGNLSEDAAGNLQLEIDDLNEKVEGVITKVNENTAVLKVTEQITGGTYYVTNSISLPSEFTIENSYIKSVMFRKISGTGSPSTANEWYTGSEINHVYNVGAKFTSKGITVSINAGDYSLKGSYQFLVVLEKIVE